MAPIHTAEDQARDAVQPAKSESSQDAKASSDGGRRRSASPAKDPAALAVAVNTAAATVDPPLPDGESPPLPEGPPPDDDGWTFEWDAKLAIRLLDLYILHAGRTTYGMLTRRPFLTWVERITGRALIISCSCTLS